MNRLNSFPDDPQHERRLYKTIPTDQVDVLCKLSAPAPRSSCNVITSSDLRNMYMEFYFYFSAHDFALLWVLLLPVHPFWRFFTICNVFIILKNPLLFSNFNTSAFIPSPGLFLTKFNSTTLNMMPGESFCSENYPLSHNLCSPFISQMPPIHERPFPLISWWLSLPRTLW